MGEEIAKDISAIATAFGHVSAYVDSMVLKCAVQLKLANIVHAHAHQYKEDGHAGITISQLAKSLPFNSVNDRNLYGVMRYLVHMGLFTKSTNDEGLEMSVLPLIMSAWNCLSTALDGTPSEVKHGYTIWEMLAHHPDVNENFNGTMARNTGLVMPAVAMICKGVFERLGFFVDVGGGTGLAAAYITTVFPHIKCGVLDLPHILTATIDCPNVEPIPGDMFVSIPHADAVFLKVCVKLLTDWMENNVMVGPANVLTSILHDWGDDECAKILERCKEAIPKDGGVMMIVEVVMDEEKGSDDMIMKAKLAIDMGMMAWYGGMESSSKDWKLLVGNAGFEISKVTSIPSGLSVIEARPLL